jgi:hypothetical protein
VGVSIVTKNVEQIVYREVKVVVCDGCGREEAQDPKSLNCGFAPEGWYILAIATSGDRHEACSQACAIKVLRTL